MRIRTTTGANATPLPGRNKASNQKRPQQIATVTGSATIGDRHAAAPPLRSIVPITAITVVPGGGDR